MQQQRRQLKVLNATKTARFLMRRTLEIAFPSFYISIFSGGRGACPQTPLGQRSLTAPSAVTATYYTFSGRL